MAQRNSDLDEGDLPAPRTARQRASGAPATPAPARRGRAPEVPDDLVDIDDMPEVVDLQPIPYSSERQAAFDATVAKRVNKVKTAPLFPIPEELPVHFHPYWVELVNSFDKGFFHPVDLPLMKMYCRSAYDIERCNQLIEEEGDVVWGPKGPMVNPRVKARAMYEGVLFNLTTKLRAQPASRGNSTEFQRNDQKAAIGRNAEQTVMNDDEDLLNGAQQRGSSHMQQRLN